MRLVCLLLVLAVPAAAQSWQEVAPLGTPRTDAAHAVLDGRLVVVGGRGAGGARLASVEAFDPATGTWSALAPMPSGRIAAAAFVHEGQLYVVGGSDAEGAADEVFIYNPATGTWREDNRDLDRDRDGPAGASLGGRLYVLGGADEEYGFWATAETRTSSDWEIYAPWTLAPARARMGFATVEGGLVVAGGFSTFGPLDAVERFVPGAGAVPLSPLPSGRGGVALAASGPALFAVGGRDASDAVLPQVLELTPDGWTPRTSLPDGRQGAAAAVLGADLVVAGGTDRFGGTLGSVLRLVGIVSSDGGTPAPGLSLVLDGPNPARGTVRVALTLDAPQAARVAVVDVLGREVAVLADGPLGASRHALAWTPSASGVYVVRAATGAGVAVQRVTVVR